MLPLEFRQSAAQLQRIIIDRVTGRQLESKSGGDDWPVVIELSQPVMPSELLENKLCNIRCGASRIHRSVIAPGATWSFWNQVGRPSGRNGFVEGRNIVNGRLVSHVGGGLCQLSSLIYHLALQSGLEIVERHSHSIDLYREEERFTPLGSDATVVWGFKDLRIRNPHAFAVSIACRLDGMRVAGQIRSMGDLAKRQVFFVREADSCGRIRVMTVVDGTARCHTEYVQRSQADPLTPAFRCQDQAR